MSNAPEEPRPSAESSALPTTETLLLGKVFPVEPPPAAAVLERGAAVGRYVVLDRVGSGGMGVVYSAYDPELDRKVALKLLRPDRGASAGEPGPLRLLREAQAIARLSHPNVVAVYDAGSFGDRVFVAMEFVEGRTLRRWLEEDRPAWREVLDRFLLAGRGLAAAHAAGLVHRDFKPDNVLLGKDGRVRVVDFGLARPLGEAAEPGTEAEPRVSAAGSGGLLGSPLTQRGVALGTPAYMAPEQLRGESADARTDQFSYCVSLYEALYGERPFAAADDPREIVEAVALRAVRDEPAKARVPGRLRAALLRGLSADPQRRHPSMEALLHDLEHDPAIVRRRWLAAAAVVLATGALFSGLGYFQANRSRLCTGGDERLAQVWNDERKAAGRHAFLATGVPFAPQAWRRAETALDLYARNWVATRSEACEATRLRGEQSEDLLDRRMFCLDQRLSEVRALADLLGRADAGIVERVDDGVSKLGKIEVCSDAGVLSARVPPPRDPSRRSVVEAARSQLAAAKVLSDAGKHAEALPAAQRAVAAARRAGYRPLEAEALYLLGVVEDTLAQSRQAEGTLFQALLAAMEGGDFLTAGEVASQLTWTVGFQQSRTEEGRRWSAIAEATLQGAQAGPAARSDILRHLAVLYYQEGQYPEAARIARQALIFAERAYGAEHPQVAGILSNLGVFYGMAGDKRAALAASLRSLEIRGKVLEPGHPDLAKSFNTLGNVYSNIQQNDLALSYYQRAYEIFRDRYGALHPITVGVQSNMGILAKDLGRYEEALRIYREELQGAERAYGPEHPDVGLALDHIGEVFLAQRRYAEALETCRRAFRIYEKALGPAHPDTAGPLERIGVALTNLGRAREAVDPLSRSVAILEAREVDRGVRGESRFYLAQALWESGGDRERARLLAREARENFVEDGRQTDVKEVEEWLRNPGRRR